MLLRSLSIFGFKSFADKLSVQFGEGMTGIVGPNGCGKSNVVDALRWVFGEQKASALRSSAMADVIFSGSQKRQPLNIAEVTLVIENNRNILPIDYAQVAITRRLHRSGESEYLLNKVPCRLRDIQDLFTDTGIGSSAYTTIENKMIELILSDKADERRQLFDEAAGIGKYKQRRKDSQRQLEKTSQDLLRIGDMVRESERQVQTLARHVEKAQRYKRYFEDLRSLEVGFENGRFRQLSLSSAERRRIIDENAAARELLRGKISTAESEIEQQELASLEKEEELQCAAQQVAEAGERINDLDRQISVGIERLRSSEENAQRLLLEMDDLTSSIEQRSTLRTQMERSLIERTTRREQVSERLATAREEMDRIDLAIAAARVEADTLGQEQLANVRHVSETRSRLGGHEVNLSNAQERSDRLLRETQTIEARIAQYEETIETCRRQLCAVSDAHERLQQSRETLLARIDKEDDSYQHLVAREKQCEARIDGCKAQLKFLAGLDAAFEGYESGVKELLTANLPGMLGTAADSLQVSDPQVIELVERALGSAVQTVVFDRNEHLVNALGHLGASRCGAARMVSLERLGSMGVREPSTGDGARLCEMVATVPGREILADYLLGHVRVVDSATEAFRQAGISGRESVYISRDGAVCGGDGTVVAGRSDEEQAGLLQRKAQNQQLKADVERLENEYQAIIREKEVCILNRDQAKFALVEVDERITTGRQEQQEQETTIRHHEREVGASRERLGEFQTENEQLQAAIVQLEESIASCRQHLDEAQNRQAQLEQQVETARQNVAGMSSQRQAAADHLKNIELEAQGLDNYIQQNRSDIERLGREVSELGSRKQTNLEEQHTTAASVADQKSSLESLRQQLATSRESRARLEESTARIREEYNGMMHQVDEVRKAVRAQQTELDTLSDAVHQLELQQSQEEQEMRRIRERIWEAYEIDLTSPPADLVSITDDDETVQQNISMFRERIKRVGQVNMAALEEFESESERLRLFAAQRDDLQKAVDDLEKAIKKLDREARQQFIDTFALVQKNFSQMFATLFEGGEATLELEENKDPLEANIMINARPAGKKMRGVGPLSGGERALTAIALLFGLYMVKPSAYCVLDELDAPLDEANTERFLRVLQQFSSRTQFIVITHNKRTMEAADILYGVTQQERGVSRIVSVRFTEAVLQAA